MGWRADLNKASELREQAKNIRNAQAKKRVADAAERLEERASKDLAKAGRRRKRGTGTRSITEFVR